MLNIYIIGIIIGIIILFLFCKKRENYGVFSHRSNLHGIKNQTRAHYTLQELDYQNPSDYWDGKNLSVYDRDILKYHSKRLDPKIMQ